jgi:hypothetical protein
MITNQREQAVRELAYAIWDREGRPDGKDLDHWLRAKAEIISVAEYGSAPMADTIVMEGPGYTIIRTHDPHTAIPYGGADRPDGQRNHGFIDLRDHPELVTLIPEAQDSVGMQAILRALNAPGFRFMSLGCARRAFPCLDAKPGEPTHLCDGYIQVAYRDRVLNTDPARFITLAQVILTRISPSAEHHIQFAMTVEPLRSFFDDEGHYALIVQPRGYGDSEATALAAWDHATKSVAAVFTHLRSEPSPLSTNPPDK